MNSLRSDSPLIRFLLALGLGAIAGLAYGWLIQPVEFVDTTPDSLRADYRADYVLMVAEAYSDDQDLEAAKRHLAALGPQPPVEITAEALDYAQGQNFAGPDVERLESLLDELQEDAATPEIGGL